MTPDERIAKVVEYTRKRLREEVAALPRGGAAELARKLDIAGPHISNMIANPPTRSPGEAVRRVLAAHWGMTLAQLEAAALGESLPEPRGAAPSARLLDESVPPFERAAMLARNSGISEESIHQAGKMRAFSGSASFRETDYLAAMLAAERERLGKPTAVEVVPEEPDDDPAARLKAAAKKKARR